MQDSVGVQSKVCFSVLYKSDIVHVCVTKLSCGQSLIFPTHFNVYLRHTIPFIRPPKITRNKGGGEISHSKKASVKILRTGLISEGLISGVPLYIHLCLSHIMQTFSESVSQSHTHTHTQ